ncbi:MAG: acyl-protein synthase [Bdellovibrio sp. CG12_big_fil_rev_8_21_14_0_65_39_13]|nr:MAG: acyl-protein synthase [Bdellovibrio sp. CG22_combo_CG10-13_8_21_14_all_39_27]PIQ58444.1 MAG: acyl-protein synthase [Bdellovibrio sp. CG12_big_fil_rev_8_21_14_0_65_39_13]PIR35397.1 MAG: acyl-protein synthase [Bdellovibrio sp. CG11_big_fil_rev_8_21_14_0_20_39_38]
METNLKVPSESELSQVQKLCDITEVYSDRIFHENLFLEAMKENISWHIERNEFYRKLIAKSLFSIDSLKTYHDLHKVPYVLANFFKRHEEKSISEKDILLHLTSSGTTGQKSQMFFDEWTIKSAQRMVDWIFDYYQFDDQTTPCNYLLYTYEPEEGSKLGTAYTDNFLCKYAPINKVVYALKYMGPEQGHKFDAFGVIRALREFEKEGLPVRIFGFPAFFYFTLEQMISMGVEDLKLHPESMTFFGGGWKGNQDKAIEKTDLYRLAEQKLGLKNERIRDGFGSVEHCIPYIECSQHQFHIPVHSHVIIRDVKTLEPIPMGEVGYLNFISPYITSVPANSVLMGDLAVLHDGGECLCGLSAPYFEIIGRAGITKNKSCAIAASELLKEFK